MPQMPTPRLCRSSYSKCSTSPHTVPLQEPDLAAWLKREHRSEHVYDVHMDLALRHRHSSLVYVPGYLISYQYGEEQQGSIEIVAQHHQALVAAAGPEKVLAEPHYSPLKAQVATMAAALGTQAAAVGTTAAVGSTDAVASALTIDGAFWAFLAASAAGVAARGFTGFKRDRHSTRIEAQADSLHAAYMRDGVSAYTIEDSRDLRMRADAEWLRWEEGEVWNWDHGKRRRWAERLFAEQAARRCAPPLAAATAMCLLSSCRAGTPRHSMNESTTTAFGVLCVSQSATCPHPPAGHLAGCAALHRGHSPRARAGGGWAALPGRRHQLH